MKQFKKMNLAELRKLSRNEMKALMAGSGSTNCKQFYQMCVGGSGNTFCCDGLWCSPTHGYCTLTPP